MRTQHCARRDFPSISNLPWQGANYLYDAEFRYERLVNVAQIDRVR